MIQAARAIERVRRSCIKVLARPGNEVKKPGDSTLLVTVQQWLVASVELVEDLLQASALVSLDRQAFGVILPSIVRYGCNIRICRRSGRLAR